MTEMKPEDESQAPPDFDIDYNFASMGWHLYQQMHPNLKGVDKIKAEKVFAEAFGIFMALQHKLKKPEEKKTGEG